MLSRSTIDAVNDLDLVQVIAKFVPDLKKAGASYKAKSPFTEEKSPSFTVSPSKGCWKCFSTGKGGANAISFVMQKFNMTYPEAIKELASTFGIAVEFDDSARSKEYQEKAEKIKTLTEVNQVALEFFTSEENLRLIPVDKMRAKPETYEKFALGFAPDSWDALLKHLKAEGFSEELIIQAGLAKKNEKGKVFDFFRGRIMFPIFTDSNKLIGFSGRNILEAPAGKTIPKILNTAETEAYSKGNSLLGIHLAKQSMREMGFAVKVEGNFDVTSLHSVGLTNTVAHLGSAFTKEQIEIVKKYTDTILIFADRDKAGLSAVRNQAADILEAGMKVYLFIPYPITEEQLQNDAQAILEKKIFKIDPDDFVNSKIWNIDKKKNEFLELIEESKTDAVEWLVNSFYAEAKTTIDKTNAERQTVELLSVIADAQLRNSYVKLFAKEYKIERKSVEETVKNNLIAKAKENMDEVDGFVLPRHLSKDEIQDFSEFGFYKEEDPKKIGYYFPRGNSFKDFERVTNFIIKPVFQVGSKDDSDRIIEIQNPHKKTIIEIKNKQWLSLQGFREAVANHGNFWFKGSAFQHQNFYIKYMSKFLYCQPLTTLGWQPDNKFYAFADGIAYDKNFKRIDEYGLIEKNGEKYFLPAFSKINTVFKNDQDDYVADRYLKYNFNEEVNYNLWSKQIQKVYGNNGVITSLYMIACCFRDVIYQSTNVFPLLFFVGQPQTGKSTCARSLSRVFCFNQPEFNLNSGTVNGFQRRISRVRNSFVWLDEYTNDLDDKRFQALKSLFDGVGAEKAIMSNDNRTKQVLINSGAGISGQHYPTRDENSLLLRTVLLEFTKKQEEFTQEEVDEYNILNAWQKKGLSNLILEVISWRDYFEDQWQTEFDEVSRKMKIDLAAISYEGRTLQSLSILVTVLKIMGSKIDIPMDYQETFELCKEWIINQSSIASDTNILNSFWKMLEFLSFDNILKNNEDYKVVNCASINVRGKDDQDHTITFPQNKNVLFIRFQRVYPKYAEYHRKQTGENGHAETSLKSYMKSDKKSFLGNVKTVNFENGKTSAYAFDFDKLNLSLKDVVIGAFSPAVETHYTPAIVNANKEDDTPF